MTESEFLATGVLRIRRARAVQTGVLVGFLPAMAAGSWLGAPMAAFAIWAAGAFWAGARMSRQRCPRCGYPFLRRTGWLGGLASACPRCGLDFGRPPK